MLTEIPREFTKYSKNCNSLKRILRDTKSALEDINTLHIGRKFFINRQIKF